MSQRKWIFAPHDAAVIAQLEQGAGISPIVAQLLAARGVTDPKKVGSFLDAPLTDLREPSLLAGADRAAEIIVDAVARRRKILVYGDYDADGMTATAIMVKTIAAIGGDAIYYVPNRLENGYGLCAVALQEQARQRGAQLVITVDCGITSVAEARAARELGLDLIITDHHQFGDELPAAAAVVHPGVNGDAAPYPFDGLCGAAVAFKVAWATCQRYCGQQRVSPPLKRHLMSALVLAAIGTIADVVPMLDENRIIVRHALAQMNRFWPIGLEQLAKVAGLANRKSWDAEDIAFSIAPRLNAAGRLGQARLGVELLVTDNQERAASLAEYIDQLNTNRESLDRSIYQAAVKLVKSQGMEDDPAIVLAERGWHAGIIGVVAGRLAERFHRPCVLVTLDSMDAKPGVGSARSGGTIDLYAALSQSRDALVTFGGHRMAAGLKVLPQNVDAFRAAFHAAVLEQTGGRPANPELRIDAQALLAQLSLRTMDDIQRLAPFGSGHPRPVLCATEVRLAETPRRIGATQRHLSVKLVQHSTVVRAVAFGHGDWSDALHVDGGLYDFAFRPVLNEFAGRRRVELHLVDWRPSVASRTGGPTAVAATT